MNIYPILFAAVDSLVTHFRDDLMKHDRNSIENNPELPFLHWTRATGTDLQFLLPSNHPDFPPAGQETPYLFGTASRVHLSQVPSEVARYWNRPGSECLAVHHFDGQRLHKITTAQAVEIASRYARQIQREWDRPVNELVTA